MSLEAPPQVRRAILLLWSSLVLGIVDSGLSLAPIAEAEPELRFFMAVALFGTIAVTALLIYFVSRRHNWARIVLLLITVGGLSTYVMWPPEFGADPWWFWALTGALTVLDIAALVMLFSGSGAKWYSSRGMA